jgi:peroxiredoxin
VEPPTSTDPTVLPSGLPVPDDDGAADALPGRRLPPLRLPSTAGGEVDLAEAACSPGTLVLFAFPHAGRPGQSLPPGWDAIPGARGCTPQSCAFRDAHGALTALGARVLGLSAQRLDDLREVAGRLGLPYPLLSDPKLALAGALGMPELTVGGARMYARLTMVARAGAIVKAFYPVFPPDRNAGEVIAWLEGAHSGR